MEHSHQHSVPRGPAVLLATAGIAVVAAAASALQSALSQDGGYSIRAAAVFGLVAAVAVGGLRTHPFSRIGPANVVTGFRTMVVALLAGAAIGPDVPASGWLLVVIATLGATADALDGPLARHSGLASRFGARFDMETDALLIMTLSLLVWRVVPVGAWVLASGLLRYAFVAAGWLLPWMAADLPPSRRRQSICVAQIVGLLVALAPLVPPATASAISAASLAALTWSFAVDTRWLFLSGSGLVGAGSENGPSVNS